MLAEQRVLLRIAGLCLLPVPGIWPEVCLRCGYFRALMVLTIIVKDKFTDCLNEGFAVKYSDVVAGLDSLWVKGQKFRTSVTRQRMPSAPQTIKLWTGGGVQ